MEKPYLVFIFTLTFTLTLICISINSYKLKSARKALFYGLFKFLYKRQNGKKADPLANYTLVRVQNKQRNYGEK